jgi:hypothetical protein
MDAVIVDAPAPERPPMNTESSNDGGAAQKGGWIFLRALFWSFRRVPVWLVYWFALFVLALTAVLPWLSGFESMIGERYEHSAIMTSLYRSFDAGGGAPADATFLSDNAAKLSELKSHTARVGAVAGLLALLWGTFAAGGWLQITLGKKRGKYIKRFFLGGARYFSRFFRLLLLVLVQLSALGWLIYGKPWNELVLGRMYGVPKSDWGSLETLTSEDTVVQLAWTQAGLYALGFFGILTWARYTRTRIALHDTSSVIWNGLLTFFTMLRHPIQTLRPMILLLLVEALVLYGGAQLLDQLELGLEGNPDYGRVLLILFVAQALVAFRAIVNGARTHAAVGASQAVVRPLMRPDPWKSSVGGPGGPRYPIEDGDDEYAISV